MAKRGVWGDRMAIITPVLYKRVTCATCAHYSHEDHSCMVSPIIPRIDGFDYWKKCKEFNLSPEYFDELHKDQVKKVKGNHFFDRIKKNIFPIETSSEANEKIIKTETVDLLIEKKNDNKPKTFSDRFVAVAKEKYQIELTPIAMPVLPGLSSNKCYVNPSEKLLVITMPKIKQKKTHIHNTNVNRNFVLTDLWNRFSESLKLIITMLTDLSNSEEYEKWIVIPILSYKNDESCGEVFYKTRGHELKGIKLVEMDEKDNLFFATGPIYDKYWTAERIKNVKVFRSKEETDI